MASRPYQSVPLASLASLTLLVLPTASQATNRMDERESVEWSQWLGGPERSGASAAWPEGANRLEIEWRATFGAGYSAVSVGLGLALLLHNAGDEDVLSAIDVTTGEVKWRLTLEPAHLGHDGSDDGPLSTPCTDGERVFALGARGRLVCATLATGELVWERDLVSEYAAPIPYFGMATSPLLTSDLVIVFAGGEANGRLLAFETDTGKLRWRTGSFVGEYGSPTTITTDGVRQVVVCGEDGVVASFAEADGRRLWSLEERTDGWVTPVPLPSGALFVPLERRGIALRPTRDERTGAWSVEQLWERSLKPYSSFFAHRDGHLFGGSKTELVCLDATDGRELWSQGIRQGSTVFGDSFLVTLERDTGLLRVISTERRDAYTLLIEYELPPGEYWTPPTVLDDRLLVRAAAELIALRPR